MWAAIYGRADESFYIMNREISAQRTSWTEEQKDVLASLYEYFLNIEHDATGSIQN